MANLVLVGALADALGEPPVEAVADAACALLERKVPAADVCAAVLEEHRWAS
jgi:hypothetical protein